MLQIPSRSEFYKMDCSLLSRCRWAIVTLAWFLAIVTAQRAPGTRVTNVWGAVIIQTFGDRIPLLKPGDHSLTPLGAQKAFESGNFYRQRYVDGLDTAIVGLSETVINNSQVEAWTGPMVWTQQSAQAFYNGFYPPTGTQDAGSQSEIGSILANGTTINGPLNGTQYPAINSPSLGDPNRIYFDSKSQCTAYGQAISAWLKNEDVQKVNASATEFYQSLTNLFDPEIDYKFDYSLAYEIWDYLNYEITLNQTMAQTHAVQLDQARLLADSYVSSTLANLSMGMTSVTGRTLLGPIFDTLEENNITKGMTNKLSTYFVSYEPFVSLSALLGAAQENSTLAAVPNLGASMTIELYSEGVAQQGGGSIEGFPANSSDLYVRVLWRTGPGENLTNYNLTAFVQNSADGGVPFEDFQESLDKWGIGDALSWCTLCGSPAVFCPYYVQGSALVTSDGSNSSSSRSQQISPVIAGLIGALVTFTVLLMTLLLGMLFLGIRFRQGSPEVDSNESKISPWNLAANSRKRCRRGSHGGFKGDEKLASDIDLPSGIAGPNQTKPEHHRSSSWEMKETNKTSVDRKNEEEEITSSAGIRIVQEDEDEDIGNMKAVETRDIF